MKKNAVSWFEIPVHELDRAQKFYEVVMDCEMQNMAAMGMECAFFPVDMENGGIGGCVIKGEGYKPSHEGAVVYLDAGEDLSVALNKVEGAGGKVLLPKTPIGQNGFMAYFEDTEGNRIGLHSWK